MSSWAKHTIATAALATTLGATATASAALTDVFIKIAGVSGESKDSKHRGEVDVVSWSWGTTTSTGRAATAAGNTATKPVFDQLTFVKTIDSASPQLLQCATTGKHLSEVLLTVRLAGKTQHEYIRIKLKDVVVSSMKLMGNTDSTVPREEIGLSFAAVEYTVLQMKPDGTAGSPVTATFNFATGKP